MTALPATAADLPFLRAAVALAERARQAGNLPFGAVLVDATGTVLLRAENTVVTGWDPTAHAEMNLIRAAGARFERTDLRDTTLYASTEPCAMCAGAVYWSGVGAVVFALGESDLYRDVVGDGDALALELECRVVLAGGRQRVTVRGPVELPEAVAVHRLALRVGRAARRPPARTGSTGPRSGCAQGQTGGDRQQLPIEGKPPLRGR